MRSLTTHYGSDGIVERILAAISAQKSIVSVLRKFDQLDGRELIAAQVHARPSCWMSAAPLASCRLPPMPETEPPRHVSSNRKQSPGFGVEALSNMGASYGPGNCCSYDSAFVQPERAFCLQTN
jgi:hypothetical protein